MKIVTITVEQTIQIRQFHPLRVTATAELLDGDDPDKCTIELRKKVEYWINLRLDQPGPDVAF